MEATIFLGLAGIGYIINNQSEKHRIETTVKPNVFENSNTSIYDLNRLRQGKYDRYHDFC